MTLFNVRFFLFQLTAEQCKLLLIQAICSILTKCKEDKFRIVTLPEEDKVPSSVVASASAQGSESNEVPAESTTSTESGTNVKIALLINKT